jgi:hypothetical protein
MKDDRDEIIKILVEEFGQKESDFNEPESRKLFWTIRRLNSYLRNLKIATGKDKAS